MTPDDWLTTPDETGNRFAVCGLCGAMVVSEGKRTHEEWHRLLEGVTGMDRVDLPERRAWAGGIAAHRKAKSDAKPLTDRDL